MTDNQEKVVEPSNVVELPDNIKPEDFPDLLEKTLITFNDGDVIEGTIVRNGQARVIREDEQIAEGEITSLKHIKDEAKEIREGFECGIGIEGVKEYQNEDLIKVYELKEEKRKLEY